MKKIRIELTNAEYDMILELQDVLEHETLDETINMILKRFIEETERKLDESNPPTGGSGVPDLIKKGERK